MFRRLAQFDVTEQWTTLPAAAGQVLFGALCAGAFITARAAVDIVAPTAGPYALIYPATLISTLFGRWRSGAVTFLLSFIWAWFIILPRTRLIHVTAAVDFSRMMVNAITVLVILIFAEIFRSAVRSASKQRDEAITALKDREARMRELNEDLERQVVERTREMTRTWTVSPDLLAILNFDGHFEQSNPAWQGVLGWSPNEIRATNFLDFVHPDDLPATRASWDRTTNAGEAALRFENRYRRKAGGWCWLSWVAVPEGDKVYCSARDITAEKEGKARLAATEEALRQAQKMEAIGQLTGGVAHDFNNLLTVIRGSVDLLKRPGLSGERRDRYIDAISETTDRAAKLTGQLLAFARRQALRPELFDVGNSLQGVLEVIASLTGSRIVLERRLPDTPCFAVADRSQFDTAVVNMAVNARDAMGGEGHIVITVEAVDSLPPVRSHPAVSGDFVAISISDSGQGIAAADFDRIFEPFFTTKEVGAGTGLGLSQVFGFAKQSDGEIRVESEVGKGTTFTLYLPRAHGVELEAPDTPDQLARSGGGACVLVVEDNDQVGQFASDALKELDFDSILAVNAAQALEKLADDPHRFQAVFSDVVMPGMSGIELAGEIRKRHPDIPVVLTSGYSHVLAQNTDHGFELLHKPYSIEQLSRVLQRALASRTPATGPISA